MIIIILRNYKLIELWSFIKKNIRVFNLLMQLFIIRKIHELGLIDIKQ